MVGKQRESDGVPVHDGTAEFGAPAPGLGQRARNEIGRTLEAMYDDVVRQGIPVRVANLLEGLDARAKSDAGLSGSPGST